ncbi:unnamed protein product [Cochlearia groenlandica]
MSDVRDVDECIDSEEGNYKDMEEEQAVEYDEEEGDDDDDNRRNQNAEEELAEDDDIHIDIETADDDDDEKSASPVVDEESEKYSQLLSLPPYGSEVYICGLPKDVGEEDFRDLCEKIGDIFEVRLVRQRNSCESKGSAYVGFKTKDVAQKAIEELHSKEFKGKTIRCFLSQPINRLFICNIPKSWTEDEFRKVIEDVGPGVENVELKKDPTNSTRNRGFVFVLYYNNACADYSKQKMMDISFNFEGNRPIVTWADPKGCPERSAAAAQVFFF